MAVRPWLVHAAGTAALALIALLALETLAARRLPRDPMLPYAIVALLPAALWLLPPVAGGLVRACFRLHRLLWGGAGAYLRLPPTAPPRLPTTFAMALGPTALSLLVLAQLVYLRGVPSALGPRPGALAFPALLVAVAILTSLAPGVWLLDGLNLRFADPRRALLLPVSGPFQRSLGPAGALAGLGSFVVLLHVAGYSYEVALALLAAWIAVLFPPIVAATSFYRLAVEPRALPGLMGWLDAQGVRAVGSPAEALGGGAAPPPAAGWAGLASEATPGPTPRGRR